MDDDRERWSQPDEWAMPDKHVDDTLSSPPVSKSAVFGLDSVCECFEFLSDYAHFTLHLFSQQANVFSQAIHTMVPMVSEHLPCLQYAPPPPRLKRGKKREKPRRLCCAAPPCSSSFGSQLRSSFML